MSFFKKHPFITALLLIVTLAFLISASLKGNEISSVENGIGNAVAPASGAFNRFTNGVGSWFRLVFGISDIQKEVAGLRERNAQLENELAGRKEQGLENERLKAMLKLVDENPKNEYIAARVIGKNSGYWFTNFSINQGRNHGLKVGCVVVNTEGALVGRISEVGGNWSKVEAIIDAKSNISAIIERTRDDVMVRGVASVSGNDSGRLCELYTLPLDNDLQPGDVIVTSGLGKMGGASMPKGIPIGEVVSVDISSTSIERTALLQPKAGFTALEEVLVIVGVEAEKKTGTVSAQPVSTAQPSSPEGSLIPVEATATPPEEGALSTPENTGDSGLPLPQVEEEPNIAPAFGNQEESPSGVVDQSQEGAGLTEITTAPPVVTASPLPDPASLPVIGVNP